MMSWVILYDNQKCDTNVMIRARSSRNRIFRMYLNEVGDKECGGSD